MKGCRGQVALEHLVVLAAFLGFLSLWAGAFSRVDAGARSALLNEQAVLALTDLASAGDKVWAMGEGNELEALISLSKPCKLGAGGGSELSLECAGKKTLREVDFKPHSGECDLQSGENRVRVKNKKFEIWFEC